MSRIWPHVGDFATVAAEVATRYRRGIPRIPLALQRVKIPIITAINGPVIGAGFGLAKMAESASLPPELPLARYFSISASSPVAVAHGFCNG